MRVCFQLQVRPERIEEYKARHRAVWPEMLRALDRAGWSNYSIFLRADGQLTGYFETQSLEESIALMDSTDVNARWQSEMADFFVDLDGRTPDHGFLVLEEIFNLSDQLEALTTSDEAK